MNSEPIRDHREFITITSGSTSSIKKPALAWVMTHETSDLRFPVQLPGNYWRFSSLSIIVPNTCQILGVGLENPVSLVRLLSFVSFLILRSFPPPSKRECFHLQTINTQQFHSWVHWYSSLPYLSWIAIIVPSGWISCWLTWTKHASKYTVSFFIWEYLLSTHVPGLVKWQSLYSTSHTSMWTANNYHRRVEWIMTPPSMSVFWHLPVNMILFENNFYRFN